LSKALWRGRQLDEVLALDPAALGPRERAFLDASRRHAARRRRYLWWLAVLTALLVGIGLWEGVRLEAQRRNRRLIAAAVSEAGSAWTEGRTHDARARGRREQALALFDGRAHPAAAAGAIGSSEGGWNEAERVWGEALAEGQRAEAAYARADQALATALLRDSSRSDVREQQAALTYDRILLAEGFHQSERRGELLRQLERLDDEQRRWAGRLTAAAELRVETWPPATRVTLMRYVDEGGVRRLEQAPRLGGAGGAAVRLPPGSYRLEFTREGWTPVHLPILLERGEEQSLRIELPLLVPVGYVYIPPGCFLFGGGDSEPVRKFMHASPLHRVCQDQGYLIGRTEVTVGDWLDYLSELPRDAPERRLFAAPHFIGGGMLLLRPEGSGWRYSFSISQDRKDWPPPLREGALFAYVGRAERALQDWRRFPMSGVSVREIQGYLAWLDRSGRLPGARLCREDEWERAARGADDRRYPHGDRLLAEEANVDETYGRRVKGFGPDAVGSYPASVSPFGLMDMSGNALEWTTSMPSEPGSYIIRGGAWYYDAGLAALAFNRTPTEPDARDVRIGLRVCAPSR
jgi:formylglycine-generating enzyme required for sulfatase activity